MRVMTPEQDAPRPAATTSVETLVERASAGDPAATAELLRRLAPEMQRVVRGVMGPHADDADDALQQALVALIHAMPAFRGECAPAGYACRIAFRTALALRKKADQSRRRHDPSPEATDLLADPSSLEAKAAARRRTDLLRRLLDEVPVEQGEALAMRTMLGWSLEEIAQSTGAPLNTVRSRLRLAKEALRRKIEADPALAEELGVSS